MPLTEEEYRAQRFMRKSFKEINWAYLVLKLCGATLMDDRYLDIINKQFYTMVQDHGFTAVPIDRVERQLVGYMHGQGITTDCLVVCMYEVWSKAMRQMQGLQSLNSPFQLSLRWHDNAWEVMLWDHAANLLQEVPFEMFDVRLDFKEALNLLPFVRENGRHVERLCLTCCNFEVIQHSTEGDEDGTCELYWQHLDDHGELQEHYRRL